MIMAKNDLDTVASLTMTLTFQPTKCVM